MHITATYIGISTEWRRDWESPEETLGPILVGNDLSERSNIALARAAVLAQQLQTPVEALTVIEELFFEETTKQKKAAANVSAERLVAGLPGAKDLDVSTNVVVGIDFNEILHRGEALDAGLIVLGAHRHALPELFRGTTAERVVRYGERPVLVVKKPANRPYEKTLVATDLSDHAARATQVAASLTPKGEVTIMHAVQRPFTGFLSEADQDAAVAQEKSRAKAILEKLIEEITADLGDAAPTLTIKMPEGNTRELIGNWLKHEDPDLLAMGTHGRTGISHALIGSTAEEFLSRSKSDVLVTKSA